jgi:N-acetylglucosaminyldiphosphoundecaprenol N-acetyl-beta-D-mannosaminyltransferase
MSKNKILKISIPLESKKDILEKIRKYILRPRGFFHIVSLNPENLVIAEENSVFKKTIETAQIKIVDGIGIVLAARWLDVPIGDRMTGVELMEEMVKLADKLRLRVLLIGAKSNLALTLAECYNSRYAQGKFKGAYGIQNIKSPRHDEEKAIFSIVRRFKPHVLLISFGSPDQELWLDRHRKELSGIVAAGVGGAFDYLSGNIIQPPKFIRRVGFEWLFRLINQPWRWKRQLRLVKFARLILEEKWKKK